MGIAHNHSGPTVQLILNLVRLRAAALARQMEALWQAGETSPDQGLAITAAEVARLLQPAPLDVPDPASFAAASALAADPGWAALRHSFGLDDAEADLLALLLAIDLDPSLGRVMAYLHDDARMAQPTPWLSARLAGQTPAPFAGTPLLRWRLAAPLDAAAPQRLLTAWQADSVVTQFVHSGDWRDPALGEAVQRLDADGLPCLHPSALAALQQAADLRDVELVGPPGSGRQTLAAQCARQSGMPLLAADLPDLLGHGLPAGQAIVQVLRQARIGGGLAYFRDADAAPAADWARARRLGVPYLRGVRHATGAPQPVTLTPLPIAGRLAVWRHASEVPPSPLLLTHRLTAGEVSHLAAAPGVPLRRALPDSQLLSRLACPYSWDDLVLPVDVQRQLREFENQVRLRWSVYEDWGFQRLTHLGNGIAALFGGPSGTGKTMAAQVLARSLGLDLLRVDLAGVVNKYVGETEKKLRKVFDACEHSGALLFFDEADALFGSRMQVKDAHDRFANIEIDYLLQRIERFDGIAILATNRRQDLDNAFVRRLRFVIEFLAPRPEERLALWRRALLPNAPDGTPILGEIDWAMLAERLQMTGAEIKGTALTAAFLARAEDQRIDMRHVLAAAQREMAKQGAKLRVPLREASGA